MATPLPLAALPKLELVNRELTQLPAQVACAQESVAALAVGGVGAGLERLVMAAIVSLP